MLLWTLGNRLQLKILLLNILVCFTVIFQVSKSPVCLLYW